MATFYADSSVLIKRHVNERGSDWVRRLCDPAQPHTIITARQSIIEVMSVLNRRSRDNTLSIPFYVKITNDFLALCRDQYRVIALSNTLFDRAHRLLEKHPLRPADALHLAAALLVNHRLVFYGLPPLTFLATNQRLLAAAAADKLATGTPLAHP